MIFMSTNSSLTWRSLGPLYQVGSQSPAEHISGIWSRNISVLSVICYPTVPFSPSSSSPDLLSFPTEKMNALATNNIISEYNHSKLDREARVTLSRNGRAYSRKQEHACKKCLKRAKKSRIFKNFGKNAQDLKIPWKRAGVCVRLLSAINC